MSRRHAALKDEQQWRDAAFMACIVNSGFCRPKDGVKPSDFMPKPMVEPVEKRPRKKRMTAKQRTEVADGLRGVMRTLMKAQKARAGG